MSASVTVVLQIDLRHLVFGKTTYEESKTVDELQKSTKGVGMPEADIRMSAENFCVLQLPKHEKAFGYLVYWCNQGQFPYKTLWLNDVAQWQQGAVPHHPESQTP